MFHMDFLDAPGNYTFTLKITYRETKEQTEYVMKQAKAIVSSITQVGMDDARKSEGDS